MVKKKTKSKGMVDVTSKGVTKRVALAMASIQLSAKSFKILLEDGSPKGNVFETARVAAVMAAKGTPNIVPLCHPLELGKVSVDFKTDKKNHKIDVLVETVYKGRTGVEMEALTAASAAALTIYDMMKWSGQDMTISDVKLLKKTGGKSGTYKR